MANRRVDLFEERSTEQLNTVSGGNWMTSWMGNWSPDPYDYPKFTAAIADCQNTYGNSDREQACEASAITSWDAGDYNW
jgi:hypothetical protein